VYCQSDSPLLQQCPMQVPMARSAACAGEHASNATQSVSNADHDMIPGIGVTRHDVDMRVIVRDASCRTYLDD
jgi:hypothetical protein